MRFTIIVFSLFLLGLTSCKKLVIDERLEFVGYWDGGSYNEDGYMYIKINVGSMGRVFIADIAGNHIYDCVGLARANDKKLTIGGTKYFKIIEYPHRIDPNVEQVYVNNHINGTSKLATWKMILDGLKGSPNCNVGTRTYYLAD